MEPVEEIKRQPPNKNDKNLPNEGRSLEMTSVSPKTRACPTRKGPRSSKKPKEVLGVPPNANRGREVAKRPVFAFPKQCFALTRNMRSAARSSLIAIRLSQSKSKR